MIYEEALTIAANTAKASPVTTEFVVVPGVVSQVNVQFPPGCAGLVHLQVFYAEHQIWPTGLDQDFSGDGINLIFPEDLEITEAPYVIELRGWNLDEAYSHTVTLRLSILPPGGATMDDLIELLTTPPEVVEQEPPPEIEAELIE